MRHTTMMFATAAMLLTTTFAWSAVQEERFSATAVDMAVTTPGAVAQPVTIVVTRWASDDERTALVNSLREQGASALLRRLEDMPVAGSIARIGSVGEELRYAWRERMASGAERVVLIAPRPLGLWELRSGSRTVDYPFTLIEIRVGADGKGEGKASVATKVTYDAASKSVVLEDYGTQPVALKNVEREK